MILSEILDTRTRQHVSSVGITDYVLSNELVSMVIAQVLVLVLGRVCVPACHHFTSH